MKSGVKIIGLSDATTAIFNPNGIDVVAADQHAMKKGNLRAFMEADRIDPNELLTKECATFWFPRRSIG